MLKRHRETLENRLEEIQTWGWTQLTWGELYLWYTAERLSVKTYKHILESYRELRDDEDASLLVTTVAGGLIFTSPAQTSQIEDIIEHGFENAAKIG